MSFDIRLPIGLLFLIIGGLLTLQGLTSGPEIYRLHSMGMNVNLLWGVALIVFSLGILALSLWRRR